MARDKVPGKEKMRLAAARLGKHRPRRCRDRRTPSPQDTDVSLVDPSDAILSDRDDAEFDDMEEDEQDKLKRMYIQKALVSTLEWFQAFQKEIEKMRHNLQGMQNDLSWKPASGA